MAHLSQAEIKQLIAENFSPESAPNVLDAFGDRAARSSSVSAVPSDVKADTVTVEVEGQKVEVAGSSTETERRNTETGLRGQVFDRKRHEEIAEVRSGYVELTGLGAAAEKAKRQRQAEEKRRERAETAMYLAMLQDRINDLDRQATEYGRKIRDFENRHLTPEEKTAINALPEDQRLAATDAAFRRMVAEGTMTQAQYDQWKQWHADKASVEKDRDHLKDVYKNGTPEEIRKAAEKADVNDVRSERSVLAAPEKAMVEQVIDDRYVAGQTSTQDTNAAFAALGSANLFGATPTDTASHASVASKLLPESTLGEGSTLRASTHFGAAVRQEVPSSDTVKVAQDTTAPDRTSTPTSGTVPGSIV